MSSKASHDRSDYMRAFREKQRGEGVRRVNLTLSASEYEALAESAKRFEETVTRHAHTLLFGVLEKNHPLLLISQKNLMPRLPYCAASEITSINLHAMQTKCGTLLKRMKYTCNCGGWKMRYAI